MACLAQPIPEMPHMDRVIDVQYRLLDDRSVKDKSLFAFFNRFVFRFKDSVENANKEIKFFFPDFDIEKWYNDEEKYFANGNLKFNYVKLEHEIQ